MVGAEHPRRAGVGEAVFASREDAMGSEEAKYTTEGLGIRPGNFGQLLGRPRCVVEPRLSIDRSMVIIAGGHETPPIRPRLYADGAIVVAIIVRAVRRRRQRDNPGSVPTNSVDATAPRPDCVPLTGVEPACRPV